MGVYIKGLEVPKVCANCPFREVRYDPGYYNYEHCKALGKIFNEHSMEIDVFEERFNDCPLVDLVTCGECNRSGTDGENTFCMWLGALRKPTDFCSYGERKDKEGIK